MSSPPTPSLRVLRERRKRAEDWIDYASWTAMITAALGSVLLVTVGLSDLSMLPSLLPLLSALIGQGIVGYNLRSHTQWSAWGLMATYVASFVLSVVVYGVWSGILVKGLIGYVYVRGWLATLDHEELSRQIKEASAASVIDAA